MIDPYDWLGIPKNSRPPTRSQLLGLPSSTTDAALVEDAFQSQSRRLELYRHGTTSLLAQKLLDELLQAKSQLLGSTSEAGWWNEAIPDEEPPSVSVAEEPEPAGPGWWQEPPPEEKLAPPPPAPIVAVPAPSKHDPIIDPPLPVKRSLAPLWIGLSLVGCIAIAAGVFILGQRMRDTGPTEVASNPSITETSTPNSPPKDASTKITPTAKIDITSPLAPTPEFFAMARPMVFRGHEGGVTAVAINNNATRLASVGTDKTLRLWSIQDERSEVRAKLISEGVGVFFREPQLFTGDGLTVQVLSDSKILKPRELESPRGGVHSVAISPDGQRALTGLNEGTLRLWTVTSGQHQEWSIGTDKVIAVDIDRTGSTGLAITQEGIVSLWNLDRREKLLEWTPPGGAMVGKFSPSGKQIAIGTVRGVVSVYEPATKREVVSIREMNQPVTALAWLNDDKRFLTVGIDETARLWSATSGKSLRWFQKLDGKGTSVAVDDRNRFAAVGTQNGVVHLLPLPLLKPDESIPPAAPPPAQPYSLPSPNQVAQAMAPFRSSLTTQLAQARPEDVAIVADNLLRQGLVEKVETPLRYGLLQEARQLAIRADDAATARASSDGLIAWFEVDPLVEYVTTLEQLPTNNPHFTLQQALALIELAEVENRPELVSRLTSQFLTRPPEDLSPELKKRIEEIKQLLLERKELLTKVREAYKTLQTAPAEPNANLLYGKYLSLFRLDWSTGLTYLARTSDASYREAALADLADPKEPKEQITLGEKWVALAGQDKVAWEKRSLLSRAYYWLEKASQAKLDFAEGVKVKARLQELAGQMAPPKGEAGLRPMSSFVQRRHYNTLNESVFAHEWQTSGNVERVQEGVRLRGEMSGLQSRFQIVDGSRVIFTIRPDGREMIFSTGGEEFRGSGLGDHYRITIERQGSSLRFTALDLDQGKTATKSFELTGSKLLPTKVSLQLRGTSKKPDGALLTTAVLNGPAKLNAILPE
jgi:hypothetical protein